MSLLFQNMKKMYPLKKVEKIRVSHVFNYILIQPRCSQLDIIHAFYDITYKEERKVREIIRSYIRRLCKSRWITSLDSERGDVYIVNYTRVIKKLLEILILQELGQHYRWRKTNKIRRKIQVFMEKPFYKNLKVFLSYFFAKYAEDIDGNSLYMLEIPEEEGRRKWFFIVKNFFLFNFFPMTENAINIFYRKYFRLDYSGEVDRRKLFEEMKFDDVKDFFEECDYIYRKINKKNKISPLALLSFLPEFPSFAIQLSFVYLPFYEVNKKLMEGLATFHKKLNQIYWNKKIRDEYFKAKFSIYGKDLKAFNESVKKCVSTILKLFKEGYYDIAASSAREFLAICKDGKIDESINNIIKDAVKDVERQNDVRILYLLRNNQSIRSSQIPGRLNIPPHYVNEALKRLKKRGLIWIEKDVIEMLF